MSSRIPTLLEPYIQSVPQDSLILLTSTLGNTSNWLLIRYLNGVLSTLNSNCKRTAFHDEAASVPERRHDPPNAVILVSWLRDWDYWKTESRRAGGLDLVQLSQKGRFIFIDGLTNLFSKIVATTQEEPGLRVSASVRTSRPPRIPALSNAATVKTELSITPKDVSQPTISPNTTNPYNIKYLTSSDFDYTKSTITEAISSISSTDSSVLLILDAPDFLLSATSSPTTASLSLQSLILTLRQSPSIHSTLITVSASIAIPQVDHHDDQITPTDLDIAQKSFVVGLGHQANLLMQLRPLDTGAAKDVSGILRVTRGSTMEEDEGKEADSVEWREMEVLYHVRGDGVVRLWERGEEVG